MINSAQALILLMLGLLYIALVGFSAPDQSINWLELRLPRILVAGVAGIILGISGLLLQTLLKNPLASPDVSGLTTSGVLFAVLGVVLVPGISANELVGLTLAGSIFALALLMLIGRLTGFQPQLFALSGLCISALAATLINIVLVLGSNQSSEVLVWLSGSTYHSSWNGGWMLGVCALVLCGLAFSQHRKLDIYTLGQQWSGLLGINRTSLTIGLLAIIAISCALTVSVVGGISFVGLMAPHICRVIGISAHRHLIFASAMCGALLLIAGDAISRNLLFPFELPTGLVVSCIGGFYFISLLLSGKYLRRN